MQELLRHRKRNVCLFHLKKRESENVRSISSIVQTKFKISQVPFVASSGEVAELQPTDCSPISKYLGDIRWLSRGMKLQKAAS